MTDYRVPFTRSWCTAFVVCAMGALLSIAPAIARAQGQPVPPPPAQQPQQPQPPSPQKRRALEIRGQAPAPEVVTVRPREIPQFQRAIIAPILYDAPPAAAKIAYYIVLPGPLPEPRSAAQSTPAPKPF
jgi:hypothetical protein